MKNGTDVSKGVYPKKRRKSKKNTMKKNRFDTSNYILTASNNLINKIKENDNNSSNYNLFCQDFLIIF